MEIRLVLVHKTVFYKCQRYGEWTVQVRGSKEADICNGANEARIPGEGSFELILFQGNGWCVHTHAQGWEITYLPRYNLSKQVWADGKFVRQVV